MQNFYRKTYSTFPRGIESLRQKRRHCVKRLTSKTYSTFPRGIERIPRCLGNLAGQNSKTYSTFPRGIESNQYSTYRIDLLFVRPIRHSHGELKAGTISHGLPDTAVRPIRHSHGELKGEPHRITVKCPLTSKTYSTFPRGIERKLNLPHLYTPL